MNRIVKTFAKGGIATAAVGAMALAGASPAQARDRDRDGISIGEVIAGAVIIGGIAAIASSSNRDRDYYRDGRYRHNQGNPRAAVKRCVTAASQDARRFGNYRYAQVTEIRDVDDTRYGWKVKGRIVVDGNNYRGGRSARYQRRNGRDSGKFTCHIDNGRVAKVDFSGIRRLP